MPEKPTRISRTRNLPSYPVTEDGDALYVRV